MYKQHQNNISPFPSILGLEGGANQPFALTILAGRKGEKRRWETGANYFDSRQPFQVWKKTVASQKEECGWLKI